MTAFEWVLVIILAMVALAIVIYLLYRRFRVHPVLRRIEKLSWKGRLQLAGRLISDSRIPLPARGLLVVVTIYLALPIDLIPDFVPVIGWLDDVLILGTGLLLFARLVPKGILDSHIAAVTSAETEVIDAKSRRVDRVH